jgi:hypothetical protein
MRVPIQFAALQQLELAIETLETDQAERLATVSPSKTGLTRVHRVAVGS